MKTREKQEVSREDVVISEFRELLAKTRLCANQGAYLEGQRVAVLIEPYLHSRKAFKIIVSLYAFGHQKVSWKGQIIAVREDTRDGLPYRASASLDARGQAVFESLPLGNYSLTFDKRPADTLQACADQ